MCLAPHNIPSAIVLTLGNPVSWCFFVVAVVVVVDDVVVVVVVVVDDDVVIVFVVVIVVVACLTGWLDVVQMSFERRGTLAYVWIT